MISYLINIIKKKKQNKLKNSLIQNQDIETVIYDYCDICQDLILNKYLEKHCSKCNKCHYKNKIYCKHCKECYNPIFDIEVIKHKKLCKMQNI